jgi:hypothetical protein
MRRRKRRPKQRPGRQPTPQFWFRRYRYHILGVVIASLVLFRCGFDSLLFPETSAMERRHYEVGPGMTPRQVEAVLGKPNYHDGETEKIWTGDWGAITLTFKDGRVSDKEFLPLTLNQWRPRRLGP